MGQNREGLVCQERQVRHTGMGSQDNIQDKVVDLVPVHLAELREEGQAYHLAEHLSAGMVLVERPADQAFQAGQAFPADQALDKGMDIQAGIGTGVDTGDGVAVARILGIVAAAHILEDFPSGGSSQGKHHTDLPWVAVGGTNTSWW